MENGGQSRKSAKADRDAVAGKASAGKIFIGGLSWETTTEKLTKHFKKYGEIIDSVVMRDRLTGHPRGFGFITYSDPSVIDKVMKDSHLIDGRTVEIKRSVPRENMKGPKTKKIFVGGIPPTVTEGDFKNYFAQFGTVVEHQIMHDHASGRSRGFGFITFDNEQAVEDILSQGKMLELGGKQVEIKKAEPKKTSQDAEPGYGPPPGRGGYEYGPGGYGGYDDGYGKPSYGIGLYGGRGGGYNDGMYGSGGYSSGSYGSGHGSSSFGGYGSGSLGGSYGSLGGGYSGSMLNQYGDSDLYGGVGYGGYGSSFGGSSYGSLGSGYGGGYSGSRSSGRYHPYARN